MEDRSIKYVTIAVKIGLAVGAGYLGYVAYKKIKSARNGELESQETTEEVWTGEAPEPAESIFTGESQEETEIPRYVGKVEDLTPNERNEAFADVQEYDATDFGRGLSEVYDEDAEGYIGIEQTIGGTGVVLHMKNHGALLPFRLEDYDGNVTIFNSVEELEQMNYEPTSVEAWLQYRVYLLSQMDYGGTDRGEYALMLNFLEQNIDLPEREENIADRIYEQRVKFFGEDAPESVLRGQTFGELLYVIIEMTAFDWGDNYSFTQYFEQILHNINWDVRLKTQSITQIVNDIVHNIYTDGTISREDGARPVVGIFGLPVSIVDKMAEEKDYSFIDQYNDSIFGDILDD